MTLIKTITYSSPFGELILGSFNEKLCLCDWKYRDKRNTIDNRLKKHFSAQYTEEETTITLKAKNQLEEYFNKKRKSFDIPLIFAGTEFQIKVWNELLYIQFGNTKSYLNLSKELSNTKAIRAVAGANGANSISIFVPCHRIIGSNNELTGYAGGNQTKKKLLELENALPSQQLSLF